MTSLPLRHITQQQSWEVTPMNPMLRSKYSMELPRPATLMPHTGRSAKALVPIRRASTDSAPSSHHPSGSSSGSVSLGYESASSGSTSDGASDDDLVNRYFAGTFPMP
ncbi:hypothetical protein PIB30_109731 [Stylosanthes scabra]|uniref:Uncharacterized protein n=1 Tax=Stylosanthes scabra TaxID=79078 RepID=A0ABU6QZ86_9FABA|nr:hypothetical protein [Stylosanthes scabra]